MTDHKAEQAKPTPLPSALRLLVALAALSATHNPPTPPSRTSQQWHRSTSLAWLTSVCKLLPLDLASLPPSITESNIRASAAEQRDEWSPEEVERIGSILVEASLAVDADKKKKEEALTYTPMAKALSFRTLVNLGLDAKTLLPEAEKRLAVTLFKALQAASDGAKEKVESTRAAHSEGWGGSLGRTLATGAGVIAGGVLIGVTGGLAAPAIAAILAPLGISGLIGGAAAPVVLGTLFGVGGGGLAGRRVRERWRGVEEFSFIEVGAGTKATQEEVDEMKAAKERYKAREKKAQEEGKAEGQAHDKAAKQSEAIVREAEKARSGSGEISQEKLAAQATKAAEEEPVDDAAVAKEVERDRQLLEEKLLSLSLDSGARQSMDAGSAPASARPSLDSPRTSLDHGRDEKPLVDAKNPPSLTATIVVPGLLTVSKTEAITAWRAICSANTAVEGAVAPRLVPREKSGDTETAEGPVAKTGLKDGRDVYLLRFESAAMLKTGRDIDLWVASKIKGKIKSEIIKRTVLKAYFAAIALPMSVYSMATMSLDNTWMQAQDRASKAGRLLGEVLEKRVQGERPVVLIGSSVGALTVLKALLYLASLPPPPGASSAVPTYVESAYLISLPSAPTEEEWAKCRSVVARRLVNAWSGSDFVLAGVVRLHEVVSRAATLSNGIAVAGLGPVERPGVQDVDVSSVLHGHMELQAKMGDVLRIIDVDA